MTWFRPAGASFISRAETSRRDGPGNAGSFARGMDFLGRSQTRFVFPQGESSGRRRDVFKANAARAIHKQGPVLASFENEPKNLVALHGALFPEAMHVFSSRRFCSDNPAEPREGLYKVRGFSTAYALRTGRPKSLFFRYFPVNTEFLHSFSRPLCPHRLEA